MYLDNSGIHLIVLKTKYNSTQRILKYIIERTFIFHIFIFFLFYQAKSAYCVGEVWEIDLHSVQPISSRQQVRERARMKVVHLSY